MKGQKKGSPVAAPLFMCDTKKNNAKVNSNNNEKIGLLINQVQIKSEQLPIISVVG